MLPRNKDEFIQRASVFHFYGMRMTRPCIHALADYIYDRLPPEGFLAAVLTNNLTMATMEADDYNIFNIPAYVAFLHQNAPMLCWGSEDNFAQWLNKRSEEDG